MSELNNKETITRRRSFKDVLTHNLGLKILSLFFAVLLWCYVVNQTNPIRVRTYNDVAITVAGMDVLEAQKLIPLEVLRTKLPKVSVTLNVPHREIASVSSANIDVSLDLSGITEAGKYQIPLKVKSGNSEVTVNSYTPSSVEVIIEDIAYAEVPVSITTVGRLPEGLYKGTATSDPQTLQISGPESYISCITRAQVEVDLALMTDGYAASMQYTYVDKDGNSVNGDNITANKDTVLVNMGILSKKTVPLEFLTCLKNADKLKEGYGIAEAVSSMDSVTVVGSKEILDNIDKMYIQDIDLTDLGPETTSLSAAILVPEGVQLLSQAQPTISITIAEKRTSKDFNVDIEYTNNSGKNMQYDVSSVKVTVSGGYFALLDLTEENISVIADTTGLEAGSHKVRLEVKLDQADPLITLSATPETVAVTITD